MIVLYEDNALEVWEFCTESPIKKPDFNPQYDIKKAKLLLTTYIGLVLQISVAKNSSHFPDEVYIYQTSSYFLSSPRGDHICETGSGQNELRIL